MPLVIYFCEGRDIANLRCSPGSFMVRRENVCENANCRFSRAGGRLQTTASKLCAFCDPSLMQEWCSEPKKRPTLTRMLRKMENDDIREIALSNVPEEYKEQLRASCSRPCPLRNPLWHHSPICRGKAADQPCIFSLTHAGQPVRLGSGSLQYGRCFFCDPNYMAKLVARGKEGEVRKWLQEYRHMSETYARAKSQLPRSLRSRWRHIDRRSREETAAELKSKLLEWGRSACVQDGRDVSFQVLNDALGDYHSSTESPSTSDAEEDLPRREWRLRDLDVDKDMHRKLQHWRATKGSTYICRGRRLAGVSASQNEWDEHTLMRLLCGKRTYPTSSEGEDKFSQSDSSKGELNSDSSVDVEAPAPVQHSNQTCLQKRPRKRPLKVARSKPRSKPCSNEFCHFSSSGSRAQCQGELCPFCDVDLLAKWLVNPMQRSVLVRRLKRMVDDEVRELAFLNVPKQHAAALRRACGMRAPCCPGTQMERSRDAKQRDPHEAHQQRQDGRSGLAAALVKRFYWQMELWRRKPRAEAEDEEAQLQAIIAQSHFEHMKGPSSKGNHMLTEEVPDIKLLLTSKKKSIEAWRRKDFPSRHNAREALKSILFNPPSSSDDECPSHVSEEEPCSASSLSAKSDAE